MGTFYGSDYFLDRVAGSRFDLETLPKRLGDAWFDTRLIRDAVVAATGQRWLDPEVADDSLQYKRLLDNAAEVAHDLKLSVGVSLTTEQIAALDRDIVWYETRIIDGQEVLVPQLYLAQATRAELTPQGAVIAGASVDLSTAAFINSSGTIRATDDLVIAATESLRSSSGTLRSGGDIALSSAGDVRLETAQARLDGGYGAADLRLGEGRVEAGGTLSITAGKDVTVSGAQLKAGLDALVQAGGDVTLTASAQRQHETVDAGGSGYSSDSLRHHQASLAAGGDVSIVAGQDVAVLGTAVSGGGAVTVAAGGDVTVAAVVDTAQTNSWMKKSNSSASGAYYDETVRGSSLTAGNGDVTVVAGLDTKTPGEIAVVGSNLTATGGDVTLAATGDIAVAAVEERHSAQESYSKDRGYLGHAAKQTQDDSLTQQGGTITATGSVTLDSDRGNIAVQAGTITAGEDVTLRASEGMVALLGGEESSYHRQQSSGSNLVWQQSQDKGESHQTVKLTTITAGGDLTVEAAKGVVVDTRTPLATPEELRANPATAWMAELAGRNDVVWQQVAEAHDHWDYKQQGLSGPAATLISIAISVALGGTDFGLGGTLLGDAANAGLSAGLSALSSQAAIALINNGGDIGKALQELGSADSIRNLATAMITAGLTSGISQAVGQSGFDLQKHLTVETGIGVVDRVQTALVNNVTKAVVRTSVESAINGEFSGKNFADALKGAAITAVGAELSSQIGLTYREYGADGTDPLEYFVHKVAHAALGCGTAAASGADCTAGAVGGATSAIVAGILSNPKTTGTELAKQVARGEISEAKANEILQNWEDFNVDVARLSGATAALLAGAKDSKDIYAASDAAENTARHNIVETAWDVFSLSMSINELGIALNDKDSDVIDILLAGGAVVIDTAGVLLPGVPAGAGAALGTYRVLKAAKQGDKVVARITLEAVDDGVQGAKIAIPSKNWDNFVRAEKEITLDVASKQRVDDVIKETLSGKKNFTSSITLSADEALSAGQKYLGEGYKEIGNGVFRSADGVREFRIDSSSLSGAHAPGIPHVHFGVVNPSTGKYIANNHVPYYN